MYCSALSRLFSPTNLPRAFQITRQTVSSCRLFPLKKLYENYAICEMKIRHLANNAASPGTSLYGNVSTLYQKNPRGSGLPGETLLLSSGTLPSMLPSCVFRVKFLENGRTVSNTAAVRCSMQRKTPCPELLALGVTPGEMRIERADSVVSSVRSHYSRSTSGRGGAGGRRGGICHTLTCRLVHVKKPNFVPR